MLMLSDDSQMAMTRRERLAALKGLIGEHEHDSNILRTRDSRLRWLGQAVPLLNFSPTLHQNAMAAGDVLARPGFSSSMYEQMEGRILLLVRQGITELEHGLIAIAPRSQTLPKEPAHNLSRRIFLVHGHAEAIREATARYLERLNLKPIILHEQPNKGRTIIEKFTDYSDVGFAVVLFTADDRGGLIDAPFEQQNARPRQNVLLELGFFLGKLGRNRVCALFRDGVEIPSDYSGVLFIKLDEGAAWKLQLARELKAAGIEVDMNKAI
jgi:predicted nucleotide-binding protein